MSKKTSRETSTSSSEATSASEAREKTSGVVAVDPSTTVDAERAARFEWLRHGLGARTWRERAREVMPDRFFTRAWQVLDEEAELDRAERKAAGKGYDYRPLIALAVGAVMLTLMEYAGHSGRQHNGVFDYADFVELIGGEEARDRLRSATFDAARGRFRAGTWPWWDLGAHAYWALWRVLGYFVVPALVVKLWFKEPLRDHGLETSGFREHAWIYAISYAIVFAAIVGLAFVHPSSVEYYPFYGRISEGLDTIQTHGGASRSWADFFFWELLYAAQFLSLEFFFRGFWMRSMRSTLGSYAIFAMVVPYCMIHYGKPLPETMGAIFAGVVLGTLALRTRSIWAGCVIHVGIAITMDVTAMLTTGLGMPQQLWPGG